MAGGRVGGSMREGRRASSQRLGVVWRWCSDVRGGGESEVSGGVLRRGMRDARRAVPWCTRRPTQARTSSFAGATASLLTVLIYFGHSQCFDAVKGTFAGLGARDHEGPGCQLLPANAGG